MCLQVSVSVPGSLGVPAHIHHITHGPVPITTTTTQQLDVVARSTPPIQQVSITTVPQLSVAAPIQQIPAVAIPVKEGKIVDFQSYLTICLPFFPLLSCIYSKSYWEFSHIELWFNFNRSSYIQFEFSTEGIIFQSSTRFCRAWICKQFITGCSRCSQCSFWCSKCFAAS